MDQMGHQEQDIMSSVPLVQRRHRLRRSSILPYLNLAGELSTHKLTNHPATNRTPIGIGSKGTKLLDITSQSLHSRSGD